MTQPLCNYSTLVGVIKQLPLFFSICALILYREYGLFTFLIRSWSYY